MQVLTVHAFGESWAHVEHGIHQKEVPACSLIDRDEVVAVAENAASHAPLNIYSSALRMLSWWACRSYCHLADPAKLFVPCNCS